MTENEKHALWNKHADIDPQFTKAITGKDYGGTSPNAHHVIWCLTDLFGPVGQGFGWRVIAEDIVEFDGTHIHWCRIEFWHTDRANTFEAYGQTKMAYTTAKGFHKVDEDAPKKSLTDAITKASAQIGIAANIFLGRWDDNKYVSQVTQEFAKRSAQTAPKVSQEEAAILEDMANRAGSDRAAIFQAMKIDGESWADLPEQYFEKVRNGLQAKLDKIEQEHDAAVREQ